MKVLVTGGAGFIGSHVVDALAGENEVVVVDNLSNGSEENVNSNVKFVKLDLGDYDSVKNLFESEKFDVVFHLAAQMNVRKSVEEPVFDARENVLNSLNLLELCVKNKVDKFVFSSSGGAIYGDKDVPTPEGEKEEPVSPYGCAKLSVEKYMNYYLQVYGLKCVALRYANVYGPRQNPLGEAGVVAIFFDSMLDGKTPVIFGGSQTRDFVYVKDVARANLLALGMDSGIFNVGTGVETSIDELFEKVSSFFEGGVEVKKEPRKKGEQERSCLSFDNARLEMGWIPEVSIEDGLKETYEWFKSKRSEKGSLS